MDSRRVATVMGTPLEKRGDDKRKGDAFIVEDKITSTRKTVFFMVSVSWFSR